MKRQIILLICVILVGGMAIVLPSFFSSYLNRKEVKEIKVQEQIHDSFIKDISSTLETIDEPELLYEQRESEIYDENQMYFENIEKLYDYLKFGEVENIKENIQRYIHLNINKDVLECKLIRDTIELENDILSFNLEIENVNSFKVKATKNNEGNIVDITIVHNIKK